MRKKECPGTAATVRRATEKGQKTFPLKNTTPKTRRQRLKAIIFWLGVQGLLPIAVAEWLIQRGGLSHD